MTCPQCDLLQGLPELESRRKNSLRITWALVLAAAVCYVPANPSR